MTFCSMLTNATAAQRAVLAAKELNIDETFPLESLAKLNNLLNTISTPCLTRKPTVIEILY